MWREQSSAGGQDSGIINSLARYSVSTLDHLVNIGYNPFETPIFFRRL